MSKHNIAILNLGIGNLYSLANSLERLGAIVTINKPADALDHVDAIILPGVGAYRDAINNPRREIERINHFLDGMLDVESAAEAVDPALYRNIKNDK